MTAATAVVAVVFLQEQNLNSGSETTTNREAISGVLLTDLFAYSTRGK